MNGSKLCVLLLGMVALGGTARAEEAALRLVLHNVKPGEGQLLVGVCREGEFLKAACTFRAVVPVAANPQEVLVPRSRLAPGRYAVQVVYDRNANRRLDTNLVGMPREPVGFSNDAVGRFGPPRFHQAAVDYDGSRLDLVIHLR